MQNLIVEILKYIDIPTTQALEIPLVRVNQIKDTCFDSLILKVYGVFEPSPNVPIDVKLNLPSLD